MNRDLGVRHLALSSHGVAHCPGSQFLSFPHPTPLLLLSFIVAWTTSEWCTGLFHSVAV